VTSSVVGRASELTVLEEFLARAADGPSAFLLNGPAGIGKTILWAAGCASASDRGYSVLTTTPSRSESSIPLTGFWDLFGGVDDELLEALPAPQRRAIDVALLRSDPDESDGPPDRRALAVGTAALLRAMSERGPVVLAIDDVQWLDDGSAAVLSFALRRVAEAPVAALLALRDQLPAPGPLAVETAAPRFERCTLGPLPLAAIHHIFVERLDHRFPRSTLVRIEEASGGNPFYALELGRALLRSSAEIAPGRSLPVPESLDALTTARIAGLPGPTREALTIAALTTEPTLEVLARAGVEDPASALEPAVRDGVVVVADGGVRFTHPLLVSTAIARSGPDELRDAHARLAAAVTSEDARARHAGLAASEPDDEVAGILDEAARRVRGRGAPAAAAELFELAASLTPPGRTSDRRRRLLDAARSLFDAGESQMARRLLEEQIEALGPGPERARWLQLLGQAVGRFASYREALVTSTQALSEAGDDMALRASLQLDIAFSNVCLGDMPAAVPQMAAAAELAERGGENPIRARALGALTITDYLCGNGLDDARLARALSLEDPEFVSPWELRPRFEAALLLLWTMRLDDAMSAFRELHREALERGDDTVIPSLDLYLVLTALWRGDPGAAQTFAEEALDVASLIGEPVTSAMGLTCGALVDAYTGRISSARERAGTALSLLFASEWMLHTAFPLTALGFAELSAGAPAAADERLRPLADLTTMRPFGNPILGIFLPDEIEAVIALDDLDRAAAYLAWLEDRNRAAPHPWADAMAGRCGALLAAGRGDLDEALARAEHAVEAHDALPMPFERARTVLVKGLVHRRRREKRLADETLREALAAFEALEAPLWAERARAELSRVGLRPRASDELTETERRVAELAAGGLTNREVGEAAFLSPKTVEKVLARVYRKLGIGSRAELGASMAVLGGGEAGRTRSATAGSEPGH
jgi:DNA-binding CsgD family transcriptional regulator